MQHQVDGAGEDASVHAGELHRVVAQVGIVPLVAGKRILVPAASHEEKSDRRRVCLLQRFLSISGVVAADLVSSQRSVVAGVSEQNRAQLAVGAAYAQDGYVRVHGPRNVSPPRARAAAIHREARQPLLERERGRSQLSYGTADHLDVLVDQLARVPIDRGFLLVV